MWRNHQFFHIWHVCDVEIVWFTLFCREMSFVAIDALLFGEKLNQKLDRWRKITNMRYASSLNFLQKFYSANLILMYLTIYVHSNFLLSLVEPCLIFVKSKENSSLTLMTQDYLHLQLILNMLNCKLNSTNGGTFCNSAETNYLIFFLLFQRALVMSK